MASQLRASRILDSYSSEDRFLADLKDAIAHFSASLAQDGDSYRVSIPGHAPFPTPTPPKPRWFRRSQSKIYEPVTTALIDFLISKFHVPAFFDIGASSGYFSLLAISREVEPPEVHSFEMRPMHHRRMLATKKSEPYATRWHPHLAAIADRHEGARQIYFSRMRIFEDEPRPEEYREKWWRRLKFWMRGIKDRDRLQKADVMFTSVDSFIDREGARPTLLKVDIDGYEGRFVDGAINYLGAERPLLLLEIHKDELIARTGTTRAEILRRILDLGYHGLLITDHGNAALTEFLKLERNSPEIERQKTDQVLFY